MSETLRQLLEWVGENWLVVVLLSGFAFFFFLRVVECVYKAVGPVFVGVFRWLLWREPGNTPYNRYLRTDETDESVAFAVTQLVTRSAGPEPEPQYVGKFENAYANAIEQREDETDDETWACWPLWALQQEAAGIFSKEHRGEVPLLHAHLDRCEDCRIKLLVMRRQAARHNKPKES